MYEEYNLTRRVQYFLNKFYKDKNLNIGLKDFKQNNPLFFKTFCALLDNNLTTNAKLQNKIKSIANSDIKNGIDGQFKIELINLIDELTKSRLKLSVKQLGQKRFSRDKSRKTEQYTDIIQIRNSDFHIDYAEKKRRVAEWNSLYKRSDKSTIQA